MAIDIIARGMAGTAMSSISGLAGTTKFKGSVASVSDLPDDANTGDVYNVEDDGHQYAFNDSGEWTDLGSMFDMSAFLAKSDLASSTGSGTNTAMTQAATTAAINLKVDTSVYESGLEALEDRLEGEIDLCATKTQLNNSVSSLQSSINTKQNALTAGTGISIIDNVISVNISASEGVGF